MQKKTVSNAIQFEKVRLINGTVKNNMKRNKELRSNN
jgi:hypothetical protein